MYGSPFVFGLIFSQYKNWVSSTPTFVGGIVGFGLGMYIFYGLVQMKESPLLARFDSGYICHFGDKYAFTILAAFRKSNWTIPAKTH